MKELIQQALDALEKGVALGPFEKYMVQGRLREAIASMEVQPVEPTLTTLDELAKVYASSYASPHHITFTVDGLRQLIAATAPLPSTDHGRQQPFEILGDSGCDSFSGDNTALVAAMAALLKLDAAGALTPHGIGGHARTLLTAAASRLAEPVQPESEPGKDAAAVMEIDKVMLHVAQHWPDVDSEAMVVRHVKFLTRMLNAELEAHRTLMKAVTNLRRAVRTGWLTGIEDWKRLYDPELLALLGCKHFQDLYGDGPKPIKREHITDGSPCWCYPEVNYTDPATGVSVIIHKDPQ